MGNDSRKLVAELITMAEKKLGCLSMKHTTFYYELHEILINTQEKYLYLCLRLWYCILLKDGVFHALLTRQQ